MLTRIQEAIRHAVTTSRVVATNQDVPIVIQYRAPDDTAVNRIGLVAVSANGDIEFYRGSTAASATTGISLAANLGSPMPAFTLTTLPAFFANVAVLILVVVSTDTSFFEGLAFPSSTKYLTAHRSPLPEMPPSEPSLLKMRIRKSCFAEGNITSKPSAPMPKWRSHIASASFDQSRRVSILSMSKKSLPAPCILVNFMTALSSL